MSSMSAPPRIGILVVDDSRIIQLTLAEMLSSEEDMKVIGTASTGQDAIRRALELNPDVILLDVNLPDKDGIQVAWTLSTQLPNTSIIMITSEDSSTLIQRAMLAGAVGYLVKPLKPTDVVETIRQTRARHLERASRLVPTGSGTPGIPETRPAGYGHRIVVFSAKGGVGKTIIATNLAVGLATGTSNSIALVDADFSFGDVCLHLNMMPQTTVADIVPGLKELDSGLLSRVMVEHSSGVKVLAPPARPEQAELVTVDVLQMLISALRRMFDYVIIDCHHSYHETNLALLDQSDLILLVTTPEMGPVRNTRRFLRLADTMGYGRERILVVVNRSDSKVGIEVDDIERSLELDDIVALPSGGRTLVTSINQGEPLVLSNPRSPWSKGILDLCDRIRQRLPTKA